MRVQRPFVAVTSEGGLLPSDFLQELLKPGSGTLGLEPTSYHLAEGEKLNEAVSRSWSRLKGCWANFKKSVAAKPEGASTTTETRERWLLPIFQELNFGRLPVSRAIEIEGKSYAISHQWENVPIHLLGSSVDLDKRTERVAGAAAGSPHSLVQQLLNRRQELYWGIVTNGLTLRLLRDNAALTRQAYVEFDLKAIFDGDLYPDFFLFWILCHQSRFEGEKPSACWLEKWKKAAEDKSLRALENLRPGVERAIAELGSGFIAHPANTALRDRLSSGRLDKQEFYRQILRTVYRILFLFVAEDRNLLHSPGAGREAQERYLRFYSLGRLRDLPFRHSGGPHADLWKVFLLVSSKLGGDEGCPELGLPALGSFLWSPKATPDIDGCQAGNRRFLAALRAIAFIQDGKSRRPVDYKNLGSEEFGSVYEGLLELHPEIDPVNRKFELKTAAGHERKTTGSYYTPDSLVQCLLDSALEPVVAAAVKGKRGEAAAQAILGLKVCDPAVGSGHFLIAAAHRMAKRVAAACTGEDEPSPQAIRSALREVIAHCLYGVDINPMSAELCKVSLWMEALEPGKPLSFLDHHIRVGNSLLGATPELLAKGIPDSAFKPIEGDDKKACSVLKKRNSGEREGFGELFAQQDSATQSKFQEAASAIEQLPEDSPEQIRKKAEAFSKAEAEEAFKRKAQLADAWCAAFVFPKTFKPGTTEPVGITQAQLNDLAQGRALPKETSKEVSRIASACEFFHWFLAFPEVFAKGGFDCVLGNPPWERVQFEERAFFAGKYPAIHDEPNQSRRRSLIERLATEAPDLYATWSTARRAAEAEAHFLRGSEKYPLSASDKFNLYAVFLEHASVLANARGNVGIIVKAGLISDALCAPLFSSLLERQRLARIIEFENKAKLFPDVDSRERFALVTLAQAIKAATFSFDNHEIFEARDANREVRIAHEDVRRLSPNTQSCPKFSSPGEYALTRRCHSEFPHLKRHSPAENPWGISIDRYINISDFSDEILLSSELERLHSRQQYIPLLEGKLFHQFDHRFATYALTNSKPTAVKMTDKEPLAGISCCRFIPEEIAVRRNPKLRSLPALLAFRDITNRTNERGVIAAVTPPRITDYTVRVIQLDPSTAERQAMLCALLNSFIFDYLARQRIGGTHLSNDILEQLPVPTFESLAARGPFILPRAVELIYSSWDLESFAQDCGHDGPPFRWNEERRFLLRCELDAAFFHLYLPAEKDGDWRSAEGETPEDLARLKASFPTPRHAVAYIMDTFPIVKRKDEEKFGSYRTKDTILEVYDALAEAIRTGHPYQTRLDPPPADSRVRHPDRDAAHTRRRT